MKRFIKNIWLMLIPVAMTGALITACSDEDGDQPVVHYVRVTDAASSDSLLVSAYLGNLVVIVGENLGDVKQVWFNDQRSVLNPSFITDSNIFAPIPGSAPRQVSNKIRLVFANGQEVLHDFVIAVPAPDPTSMKSEYVPDGGVAIIRGDYFFEPLSVTFPGGGDAEILSVEQNEIEVRVPNGSTNGPITITTNFGETESRFHFRDQRNIILNYDDKTAAGSWRPGNIGSENGIDGNYLMLKGKLNANQRAEDFTGGGYVSQYWGNRNRPEGNFFTGSVDDYLLKFEVDVLDMYGVNLEICFAPWGHDNSNQEYWSNLNARGVWSPWKAAGANFRSDGWMTVTIPMSEIRYAQAFDAGNLIYNTMQFDPTRAGSLTFWAVGSREANASPLELHIDNVRIVSK